MRRIVQITNPESAPAEVWLEISVDENGSDPVLEDDAYEPNGSPNFIRYVRADTIDRPPHDP